MNVTAAFRQARALSLTRNARFCVYGYKTVAGNWTYSYHARRPLCEVRDAPAHPARADRPCPVCGNYPSACTCRITDDSPRAHTPVERCQHGYATAVCGYCHRGEEPPARTFMDERFTGPTCNCIGTVHPIGEGACLLDGWED